MATDSTAVQSMLVHLEAAMERQRERPDEERCANCRTIDSDTALTIETMANRDLHYCANCDRLLSPSAYEHWKRVYSR